MASASLMEQPTTDTPAAVVSDSAPKRFRRAPLTKDEMDKLDIKYMYPHSMGNFSIFFGKYKESTFQEVLKDDPKYCHFILSSKPATNNMYLFQRYLKAVGVPDLKKTDIHESTKSKGLAKPKLKRSKPVVKEASDDE